MLAERISHQLETLPARSFASLMELYENNYIYLRRLAPTLRDGADYAVSRLERGVDLHLTVLDRHRYTTSISLTHFFAATAGREALPDLDVRVYHDARVAEVMTSSDLAAFTPWGTDTPPETGSLAWRWEVNRFLNRWLRYCLGEGHAVPPVSPA